MREKSTEKMGNTLRDGADTLSYNMQRVTKALASNVRRLMRERGLNQTELGRLTGGMVAQRTISNVVNEKPVESTTIDAIAKALGVEPWRLMVDPDSEVARYVDQLMGLSPGSRDFVQQVIEREASRDEDG